MRTTSPIDDVLDAATFARVPLLFWGPPGVGKSAAITDWARRRNLRCWTVIASLREPADFGGLPIVSKGFDGSAAVTFAPPRFAMEAAQEGGVIFLDELTTAPPAVQAALLRAVIDRAFGDLELDPAKVTLVAAANPPSEAAGGWDLSAPLANRFTHQNFPVDVPAWTENFPNYWGNAPKIAFGDRALEEKKWAQARVQIAAFIRSRPALLLQVPKEESKRGQAWSSPRTWDFASRLLAVAENDVATALPLISGCLGEGVAMELSVWLRDLDLPDPEVLLSKPDTYRHPDRADKAYAVLSSVSQAAVTRLTPERWSAAWSILAKAAETGGADVAAASARTLARKRRSDLPLPVAQLTPFLPILQASGLLSG